MDALATDLKNQLRLTTTTTTTSTSDVLFDADADADACSICLEPFSFNDPPTVTNCKHDYHLQCILEWSQRSNECPICCQLLLLKDSASQELLAAVEIERNSRSRLGSSSVFPSEELEHVSYILDGDFDEHMMQHLRAAALGSAHHFNRRQRHRSSGMDPSQFLVHSASTNDSNLQHMYTTMPAESQSAGNPTSPESDSERNHQPGSRVLTSHVNTGRSITDNQPSRLRPRVLESPTFPRSPRRPRPSELLSFPETLKSKFSAATSRYKESITKSTRGFKEKLLARNNSVKELSKEVQREVTAGIAGVARMMERLDPTSRNSGSSTPLSQSGAEGTSNVTHSGKGVQENAREQSPDGVLLETAHGTSSNSLIHDSNSLSSVPGRVEIAHVQGVVDNMEIKVHS